MATTHPFLAPAILWLLAGCAQAPDAISESPPTPGEGVSDPTPATHPGYRFGEGPASAPDLASPERRRLPGTDLPVSLPQGEARDHFDQRVGLLLQNWHYEADRSFQRVVASHPEHPIGHWGRALAFAHTPHLAVLHAWAAWQRQERGNDFEQQLVRATARYFGGDVEPAFEVVDAAWGTRKALVNPPTSTARDIWVAELRELGERHQGSKGLEALADRGSAREIRPYGDLAAAREYALDYRVMPHLIPGYESHQVQTIRDLLASGDVAAATAEARCLLLQPIHPAGLEAGVSPSAAARQALLDAISGGGDGRELGPAAASWPLPPAAPFTLERGQGGTVTLESRPGRPVLLVFFLGFGCLHCVEQLSQMEPMAADFAAAGIDVLTIGTDTLDGVRASLQQSLEMSVVPFPFDVLSDHRGDVFKAYGCWDDLANEALHGTYLIHPDGGMLWWDVSAEPFMASEFLLGECQRLLRAHGVAAGAGVSAGR